ncbi:MAG TPA: hypothetical protein VLQ89_02435 [Candidatus Binatia bacterium]|nr:hypothetical protein [Candidatus Binatia bacterium]
MNALSLFLPNAPAAAICLFLISSLLPAETLTYREVEGELVVTHTVVITTAPPGYRVELESRRNGGNPVRQTFHTAADLSTVAWTFSDPERRMELEARLQGKDILLSGTAGNDKFEKKFSAAGAPWNQLFQMGLPPFVMGGKNSFQFRSIGTQGPGELKIGKFTVTRRVDETITLAGKQSTAVRLRISLSGLLSVFWHGDYWYRPGDGRFLRYRGKNRSGGPVAVSELQQEHGDDGR